MPRKTKKAKRAKRSDIVLRNEIGKQQILRSMDEICQARKPEKIILTLQCAVASRDCRDEKEPFDFC